MIMSRPTRSEFRQSRFYRCALAFNKRYDERLEHIRSLLEKINEKTKRDGPARTKGYVSTWQISDDDGGSPKGSTSKEDLAILAADKNDTEWVYNPSDGDYVFSVDGMIVMRLPLAIYERLKPFQRDAVKWIGCVGITGGILGDDMGMGKTFMSIASLGARMRVKRVKMALIVAPVSVLANWATEGKQYLSQFVTTVRIVKVHGGTQGQRQKTVRNAWKDSSYERPFVIISSWGLVASAQNMKTFIPPKSHHWDYVILDEAHEIKNHTSNRSKCCRKICHRPGTKRLLLTGTPFQNDTTELWSLVHMATAGAVLGKLKQFNVTYGKPIKDARCRNAGSLAMKRGEQANQELQETLKPYLLRRSKMDFLSHELPPKIEICVWVKASNLQKQLYQEKIAASANLAKDILSSNQETAQKAKMGAFQVLAELRNLCGHPLRLKQRQDGGDDSGGDDLVTRLQQYDLSAIVKGSKKLELTVHMIQRFRAEHHVTLVFSQSTQNLDILQHVLLHQQQQQQGNHQKKKIPPLRVCRLDGSVSEKRRQDIVECFQKGLLDVLLLSTGAGGVGLTLTRASRVILYDPSWNPSQDAQAVDRAYRIGQGQPVHVYRLFVANSIEEKMYVKQVFKAGLEQTIFYTEQDKAGQANGNGKSDHSSTTSTMATRYFDKHELCQVFAQIPNDKCNLLQRFAQQWQVPDAGCHDMVRAHAHVVGISSHSTVYHNPDGHPKRKGAFGQVVVADSTITLDHAGGTANQKNKRCKTMPLEEEEEEEEAVAEATRKDAGIRIHQWPQPQPTNADNMVVVVSESE